MKRVQRILLGMLCFSLCGAVDGGEVLAEAGPKVKIGAPAAVAAPAKALNIKTPAAPAAAGQLQISTPGASVSNPGAVGSFDAGARIETPRGAHIDRSQFEGVRDHEGMRDHLPTDGAHVAGKDGADAFAGRSGAGVTGRDGNRIGISRGSGLTGADGNALWDASGGRGGSGAEAGTEITDKYGRSFTRSAGGGGGQDIADPRTGSTRRTKGRGGNSVSDGDRAAMNERNSIAGIKPFKVSGDGPVTPEGTTFDEMWVVTEMGKGSLVLESGPDETTWYRSGTVDQDDGSTSPFLWIRIHNSKTWETTEFVLVEGEEIRFAETNLSNDRNPSVDYKRDDPVVVKVDGLPEEPEDDTKPHPEDDSNKPHPDSLGDGGTAGKMHPDSVGGGGIASSAGADAMGNPDDWFMPAPDDVGGGGIASSAGKAGKPAPDSLDPGGIASRAGMAGKPAGDSLDPGGLASSIADADLRATVQRALSAFDGLAASAASAASAESVDGSAQVSGRLDGAQLDAPPVERDLEDPNP